MELFKA